MGDHTPAGCLKAQALLAEKVAALILKERAALYGPVIRKIAALIVLAGCASAPTVEQFAAACDAYGFERGTTDFANCMQRSVESYQYDRRAYAGQMQNAGAIMMQAGQQLQPRPAPPVVIGHVTTCRQSAWGVQCW